MCRNMLENRLTNNKLTLKKMMLKRDFFLLGLSGVAKVSCILRRRGVQLRLIDSWARPAVDVEGKGRGGYFYFFCFSFFPVHLFHLLYYLFYPSSAFLWETTQNNPQGLTCR